jgi:hypothetical protein
MSTTHELGRLGESHFKHVMKCILSEDKYDMEKDGILSNGETFELKTQCRYITKDGISYLTINVRQKTKCMNVDNLYFQEYDFTNYIRIWKCTNRKKYITYTTNAGNNMIGFPISEMELCYEEELPLLATKMRSLSQSQQFKR